MQVITPLGLLAIPEMPEAPEMPEVHRLGWDERSPAALVATAELVVAVAMEVLKAIPGAIALYFVVGLKTLVLLVEVAEAELLRAVAAQPELVGRRRVVV